MLNRVDDVHSHGTRSARAGLYVSSRDHGSLGYRVPAEGATLRDDQRGAGSLAGFKRGSGDGFLAGYASFVCRGCYVCARQNGAG